PSSERGHVQFRAGLQKLDLEHSIANRPWLANELVETMLVHRAVALVVDIGAMRVARRLTIEQNAEAHCRPARDRPHDQMQIARLEAIRQAPIRLVDCCGARSHRPVAAERPLIQPKRAWRGVSVAPADQSAAGRREALGLVMTEIR